jgi:hypothetical protein
LQQTYDLLARTDKARQAEIEQTYRLLGDVEAARVTLSRRLDEIAAELGPARFNSRHYETLKTENRIVELDFAVRPRRRSFADSPHMRRLVAQFEAARDSFQGVLDGYATLAPRLRNIPAAVMPSHPNEPNWMNDWLPGLDAVSLYGLVALHKPPVYFEVGSGNSTRFVRRAIRDFGLSTRIISFDPHPRADIDEICDEVHRVGIEDFDLCQFDRLGPDDMVFIDNSHRCFPNSDVTVFFLEVLGRLKKGCLYGLHDIFLPDDYPAGWEPRFYSEQYVLASYLFGGADGDKIVLPAAYLSLDPSWAPAMRSFWSTLALEDVRSHGGGFWLRKA